MGKVSSLKESLKICRKKYGKNDKRCLKILLSLAKIEGEHIFNYRKANFKFKYGYE